MLLPSSDSKQETSVNKHQKTDLFISTGARTLNSVCFCKHHAYNLQSEGTRFESRTVYRLSLGIFKFPRSSQILLSYKMVQGDRAGKCDGNALDSYSGGDGFETRPGYRLS
jgi:hypothetical protein